MKVIKIYACIFGIIIGSSTNTKRLTFPKIKIFQQIPSNYNQRLSSYPYVSGDTFRSICDFIIDKTNNIIDPEHVKNGDIIFIAGHTQLLNFFFTHVHPKINANYILVTHNSDKSNFEQYAQYLDDKTITAWFGVNLTLEHAKTFVIPIGLANKYWKHGNTQVIKENSKQNKKDILLYMNIAINTNIKKRQVVFNIFSKKPFCHNAKRKPFSGFIQELSRSKFVLSPEGNGIDCHRTWEALYLGAIPVITHSKIDPVFKNLPVLIIDNWNQITQEYLERKYLEIKSKKYKMEKLYADYWFNKISKYKRKAIENATTQKDFPASFDQSMSNNKKYDYTFASKDKDWVILRSLFNEHILHNPKYSEKPRIPKIIHQIWLGNNGELPKKYIIFQQTWLNKHPNWQYKLWTEKEINEFGLQNYKQYQQTNNYGVKADIARYEILYRIGGLYVDTDFECLKSFDILHHICDFYTGSAYGTNVSFLNGLIGSAPEHPVLLECINNIKSATKQQENYWDITSRTGPEYLTKCFLKVISSHQGPSVVLPVTYFYPWPSYCKNLSSPEQINKYIKPESFAIHHWFMAWNK